MIQPIALIRTDGNAEIGYGHVMRMMALASFISDDFTICFLIKKATGWIKQEISSRYSLIEIPETSYNDEAEYLSQYIPKDSLVLILDGYNFDTDYQKSIRERISIKTISIDDFQPFAYITDAVINHAGFLERKQFNIPSYTKLFVGPEYALLRPEFNKVAIGQSRVVSQVQTAFVCMGGTDPDIINCIIEKLVNSGINRIMLVVTNIEKYSSFLEKYKQLELHSNLDASEMIHLMKQSDIAILPPSTLSYEYCSIGGGLFLVQTYDNQKYIFSFLLTSGCGFDFKDYKKLTVSEVNNQIKLQKSFFNGNSVSKINKAIYQVAFEDKLTFRKAEEKDLMRYFEWANEEEVRNNSINTDKIDIETHKKWFLQKILSNESHLLLFELYGNPFGQVRFDLLNENYEIDYSIDKQFRNKGLGSRMLKLAIDDLMKEHKANNIIGKVKDHNIASKKVFLQIGFKEMSTEIIEGHCYVIFKFNKE